MKGYVIRHGIQRNSIDITAHSLDGGRRVNLLSGNGSYYEETEDRLVFKQPQGEIKTEMARISSVLLSGVIHIGKGLRCGVVAGANFTVR